MAGIAGVTDRARELAGEADALRRACEAVASTTIDPGRRGSFARVADRLVGSVVTPLVEALGESSGARSERTLDGGAVELAGILRELALGATRLRARGVAATSLQEATAALQDLACQLVAGDEDQLGALQAELGAILNELPATIQAAPNGPYLFTNVDHVTDWLGVALQPAPQAALCRCGASSIKPWCDGSHRQVAFNDAKSDTRVADHLDQYQGLSIAIADNRGTCAHSGFCTDRLPSVFRVSTEPFVAAAGGRADEILAAASACPSGALSASRESDDPVGRSDTTRPPAVEISLDGPYRVTGTIRLLDSAGHLVPRNEGASREHYSLCRCGKSQNKPFCSGMHWYADFHDPTPPEQATLFQWAGGFPALLRLTRRFYEVHVPQDPLLSVLFSQMSPDHPQRVAAWLGQVFGGPHAYSEQYGEYDRMISQHLDKGITLDQRARWMTLLSRSADEVGLPADPEFRAAFTAYLEWGSRIAVENSQPGVHPPPHMPVPRWWWVCDTFPWSRSKASSDPPPVEPPPPEVPPPNVPPSFSAHIKPLFRNRDRDSMRFAFDLWAYEDVAAHADEILQRIRAGTMPCDGPWPTERADVLQRWITTGKPA